MGDRYAGAGPPGVRNSNVLQEPACSHQRSVLYIEDKPPSRGSLMRGTRNPELLHQYTCVLVLEVYNPTAFALCFQQRLLSPRPDLGVAAQVAVESKV